MPSVERFPGPVVDELRRATILGVRAGHEHPFTAVWVVVVEGRVFVRSWYDRPTGWFRAFRDQPAGALQVGGREVAVRGRVTRSPRLQHAVTVAYAQKYDTRGSRKWVDGFADPARERTTLELVPRARRPVPATRR